MFVRSAANRRSRQGSVRSGYAFAHQQGFAELITAGQCFPPALKEENLGRCTILMCTSLVVLSGQLKNNYHFVPFYFSLVKSDICGNFNEQVRKTLSSINENPTGFPESFFAEDRPFYSASAQNKVVSTFLKFFLALHTLSI